MFGTGPVQVASYGPWAWSSGYTHVWVADCQMLWSDCSATLTLIADRTERIGTGVAVAGTRLDRVDPDRLHQRVHRGHNCWVEPEQEQFVTRDLIEVTCMVGTPEQLAAELRDMEAAGLSQIMLLPPLAVRDEVLRDVATRVMPLLEP